MTVSVYSIVKNESQFLGYGLMSILDWVDEVVYFDGNSTDGTLEILDYIKTKYDSKNKIRVFPGRDFKDFKEDYVKVFNECLNECRGDYKFYCHPDMILTDPGILKDRSKMDAYAYFVNMRSFGGEDMELEITKGRTDKWKLIMKNAFGLHYHGYYGSPEEDMYFRAITGDIHVLLKDMKLYSYEVKDSGIKISHFCECKPRQRREQKMETVLRTANKWQDEASLNEYVTNHPRVHLQSGVSVFGNFEFSRRKDPLPEVFERHKEEFEDVLRKKAVA